MTSTTLKYTIKNFNNDFATDDDCLEYVFKARYGWLVECPHCGQKFAYSKVSKRKYYKCAFGGCEIYPLADTIFHKSSTPLKLWFHAIYLFSVSKNGVSAKELERQIGVTYKTAWRMCTQIRKLFEVDGGDKLSGTVEVDETYVGGAKKGKRGRGADGKAPVIGVVERQGQVKAVVGVNTKASTVLPFINDSVEKGARVITDEYASYTRVSMNGFKHEKIKHKDKQYVVGDVHTNTIEGFWSQLKRSIDGTYHSVSPKYLQRYVDEFAYRYNHRKVGALFPHLLPVAAQLVDC
jgi:transposase